MAFDPDGRALAVLYSDRSLYVWGVADAAAASPLAVVAGHGGAVWGLAAPAAGVVTGGRSAYLGSCGSDGSVRLWSFTGGSMEPALAATLLLGHGLGKGDVPVLRCFS